MGLVVRREAAVTGAGTVTPVTPVVPAPPRRTFRAWLMLRLGPPPQPPRRYFSKRMQQDRGYRGHHAVPAPRRPL